MSRLQIGDVSLDGGDGFEVDGTVAEARVAIDQILRPIRAVVCREHGEPIRVEVGEFDLLTGRIPYTVVCCCHPALRAALAVASKIHNPVSN